MEIEGVFFSGGDKALPDLKRARAARGWAAHLVLFSGDRVATVVTSDTLPRLAAQHKLDIAQAVADEGRERFVGPLVTQYAARVGRQALNYLIRGAEEAAAMPRPSPADYLPIAVQSVQPIFSRDGHGHS